MKKVHKKPTTNNKIDREELNRKRKQAEELEQRFKKGVKMNE